MASRTDARLLWRVLQKQRYHRPPTVPPRLLNGRAPRAVDGVGPGDPGEQQARGVPHAMGGRQVKRRRRETSGVVAQNGRVHRRSRRPEGNRPPLTSGAIAARDACPSVGRARTSGRAAALQGWLPVAGSAPVAATRERERTSHGDRALAVGRGDPISSTHRNSDLAASTVILPGALFRPAAVSVIGGSCSTASVGLHPHASSGGQDGPRAWRRARRVVPTDAARD